MRKKTIAKGSSEYFRPPASTSGPKKSKKAESLIKKVLKFYRPVAGSDRPETRRQMLTWFDLEPTEMPYLPSTSSRYFPELVRSGSGPQLVRPTPIIAMGGNTANKLHLSLLRSP
jgi:hypothetical protein